MKRNRFTSSDKVDIDKLFKKIRKKIIKANSGKEAKSFYVSREIYELLKEMVEKNGWTDI